MAIKTRSCVLILFFLIGLAAVLEAQTSGYFLDPSSNEPRFIQRLAWRGGEYAFHYEVIIERLVNGSYQDHLRQFTNALFIDVSLVPGEYRFRVIPYDILERPGEGSRWTAVTVYPALQPELYRLAQNFTFDNNDPVLVMNIDGHNLVPGAEIYLLDDKGTRFFPNEIDSDNINNVRLFFDNTRLQSGEYSIIVRNPGGLETGMGGISINFPESESEPEREIIVQTEPEQKQEPKIEDIPIPRKPFYVNYSAAWTPVLPAYGKFSGDRDAAGSLNFSAIFLTPLRIYIGPELAVSLYSSGDMTTIGVNLLLQKRLPNDITGFNFRIGLGNVISSGGDDHILNIGTTFFVNIFQILNIEMGIDYVHSIGYSIDNTLFGCFRPWFGIGFQF